MAWKRVKNFGEEICLEDECRWDVRGGFNEQLERIRGISPFFLKLTHAKVPLNRRESWDNFYVPLFPASLTIHS